MDFLKEILGEELYNQIAEKINAHNGNEANKDKQIKLANLGSGEFVGKAKHDALQAKFDSKYQELVNANNLIEQLQKAAKGDEALQQKVNEYQNQAVQLQAKLNETLIDSGLRIGFMEAGGTDIDYLIWKAKQDNGKPFELGEDQKVKGIEEVISGLKTSSPNHFKKASSGVVVDANPLPTGSNQPEPKNLAEALRMEFEGK